jgi:hypothetical protein
MLNRLMLASATSVCCTVAAAIDEGNYAMRHVLSAVRAGEAK